MDTVHIELIISGKVQGVWYRKTAVEEALALGIRGFAMNLPDGTVRIEAEGGRVAIDRFIAWCHIGPSGARVTGVLVQEGPLAGFHGFETRR